MGTRWRGLLAPIDEPTGDNRRLARGGGGWRELPFGLKWQRVDARGHDDSVMVGSTDVMNIGTVEQAIQNNWISADAVGQTMQPGTLGVWGGGELFDDADIAADLPRLAEDVAEGKLLLSKKVIGPSIDPDNVTEAYVRKGTDKPLTWDELDTILWECEETGTDPSTIVETLYVTWRVAASTLVGIPAFAECRPFELGPFPQPASTTEAAAAGVGVSGMALVAAVSAAAPDTAVLPAEVFAVAPAGELHAIKMATRADGLQQVYGYVAAAGSCHLQFRTECKTPPASMVNYALFNRYIQDTNEGPQAVGRITTGYGLVGTGCSCCPGKDDHACNSFGLDQTISHYNQLRTVAHVRAVEAPLGIWVSGVIAPDATVEDLAVLNRRMVSGDWRAAGGNLELVELLALAKAKPAFPVPFMMGTRHGRPFSLTAAGGVSPNRRDRTTPTVVTIDYPRLGSEVVKALRGEGIMPATPGPEPAALTAAEQTGAMVALRMSEADATRLAVADYEPQQELHLTLLYLGEAADIPPDRQEAIVTALRELAAEQGPIDGNGFGLAVFNPLAASAPAAGDDLPAIVVNVAGDQLVPFQQQVLDAVTQQFSTYPEQHSPWVAHVTLAYSTSFDCNTYTDRVGPMTFDRLRVAFAGVAIDIPLGIDTTDLDPAALAAQIDDVFTQIEQDGREKEMAELVRDLGEVTPAWDADATTRSS